MGLAFIAMWLLQHEGAYRSWNECCPLAGLLVANWVNCVFLLSLETSCYLAAYMVEDVLADAFSGGLQRHGAKRRLSSCVDPVQRV